LLLLHCREAYGYELLDELKPFGFEQNAASLSAAYRILRDLEEQGMVVSRWDTAGVGPARRLYKITEEGDRYLTLWVQDLRETEQTLHQFLGMYEGHMQEHQ
jgi:poly-beta-hydroxybutyrate-responsive repressor